MNRWNSNYNKSQESSSQRWRWTLSAANNGWSIGEVEAYKLFAQMMIEKIKSFKGHWEQPWFNVGLKMPRSIYGKKYNGMNAIMLMMLCEKKGFNIPVFATREHIFAMNFKNNDCRLREPLLDANGNKREFLHILKDSKGFPVFLSDYTIRHKDTKEKISYATFRQLSLGEKQEYFFRHYGKVYSVFNIEQTNIKEARPELWQKLCDEYNPSLDINKNVNDQVHIEPLDYMIDNNKWYCPIRLEKQNSAYYSPSENYIKFPLREQFTAKGDNGVSFYGNLLHEMAHSTGHKDLLNRLGVNGVAGEIGDEHKNTYGREELVAELTSAVIMSDLGYSSHLEKDSVPYLQGWLDNLKADPEYIEKTLKDVRAAAYKINERMEQVLKMTENVDVSDDNEKSKVIGLDIDGNGIIEADEIDVRNDDSREHHQRSALRM